MTRVWNLVNNMMSISSCHPLCVPCFDSLRCPSRHVVPPPGPMSHKRLYVTFPCYLLLNQGSPDTLGLYLPKINVTQSQETIIYYYFILLLKLLQLWLLCLFDSPHPCGFLGRRLHILAPSDASGSSRVFPAPALESAISPRCAFIGKWY